jgi:hypothetical protein
MRYCVALYATVPAACRPTQRPRPGRDWRYRSFVSRALRPEHLVGAAEVAERLDMARPGIVYDWQRRHPDFPAPIARLRMGAIWSWPEVEAWALATGRLVGRG